MKKALSIALAASLAVSAIAVSAAPASAHQWHRHNNAGIAVFGALAGLAVLSTINQGRYYDYDYGYGYGYGYPPPPYYGYRTHYYGGYSPHVAWCMSHFRSYNPATGIYFRAPGVPARC